MAWYEGTFVNANAGNLIALFDAYLPLNSHWTIYDDAAGTNAKVYRNYDADETSNYYVLVNDNQADYGIIQIWEGWDAVGHAGVGNSIQAINTYAMRINRPAGGWFLSVREHRIIFINTNAVGTYIGQLEREDITKNMPVYIGELTGTLKLNAMGYFNTGTAAGWAALFDEGGTVGRIMEALAFASANIYIRTHLGQYRLMNWPIYNSVTFNLLGNLLGATYQFSSANGLNRWQTISLDGTDWLAINGDAATKYWNLIEKA